MGTSYFSQNPTTQGGKKQEITIIKELVQGQELTSQLQLLLQNQSTNGGDLQYCYSPTTTELLHKISRSFTDAISALSTAANGSSGDDHENHQAVSVFSHGEQQSSAGSGPFEEDSGESRKRPAAAVGKSGAAAGRDNRGTYKRRKTGHSSVIISPSFSQDGHGWRKYGQKEILHAKFPRSYFRCTHKHEQGCKATKQVQRLEQEDEMYSITYLGHHTCKNALAAAAVLPPVVDARATAAAVTPSVKQEVSNNNEESPSGVTVDNSEVMIGNDGNMTMWQDFVSFDLEAEEAVSNYGYDYGNYDFCGRNVASDSAILDMEFSVKDINFDDGFRFDSEQSCGFF